MKTIIMKTCRSFLIILSLVMAGALITPAQAQVVTTNTKTEYTIVDLSTGETIDIYYDTVTWKSINRVSKLPVDYYVIRYADATKMPDTVHGVTGLIVNDLIWKNDEGKWMFNDAKVKWDGNELRMKDRYGRKVKWDNGSLKIKDWNSKYKSEKGDDAKYKEEWDKIKWKDHDTKVEVGTKKTKIENKE